MGVTFFQAADPLTGRPLKVAAWYPPAAPVSGGTDVGPYHLEAREDAPPAAGVHPAVVVSHGHAGSRLGHHDLCEALARAGFVVAAVEHAGDSWNDQSAFGTDRAMFGRAYQVSAALDALAVHPVLGPHVDAQRVGVAGFSAGGYTALVLVGATPDFDRIRGYCERHPDDSEVCQRRAASPRTLEHPRPLLDGRVKAAFVMAPLALVFGPRAFEGVTAPVALTVAAEDRVLLPSENADLVRGGLKTLQEDETVSGAGHFVFLAPCSPALAAEAPALCDDPQGVDRNAVHRRLNARAAAFFEKVLAAAPP